MELTTLQSQVLEALAYCTADDPGESFTTEDFTTYLKSKYGIRKEVHHLDPVMGHLKNKGLVEAVTYGEPGYSEWKLTESGEGLTGVK